MRPTNYLRQNTVYSYSEMSFFFLIVSSFFAFFFVFFLLFYVILLLFIFTKTMSLLSLINFFFMKITFIFSCSGMFRDVPGCSGMFRNVPCSGFYRRPEKMASVNSSKSHRFVDFLPSIRPSFLSVVFLLTSGCLWVKNETTDERLIALETRINMSPVVLVDTGCTTENSERTTRNRRPKENSVRYLLKKIQREGS